LVSVEDAENRLDLDRDLIGQAAKANGRTRMLATGKSRAPARKIVCLGSPKKNGTFCSKYHRSCDVPVLKTGLRAGAR
jgi:hypothetical protein